MATPDYAKRHALELRVITHLVQTAIAHGWLPTTVEDEEDDYACPTLETVLEAVFAVDECTIRFARGCVGHRVLIVLGNDGWDCIADNSEGGRWDDVMDNVTAFTDRLEEEAAQ